MKYLLHLSGIKFLLGIAIISIGFALNAQSVTQQLRLAKSLEKNKEYEAALLLYQKLENNNPTKESAIQGIQNCLKALRKYEELVEYLEKKIKQYPSKNIYINALAEARFLNSEKNDAMKIWNSLINKQKNNIKIYRLVAGTMLKYRLVEEAIYVYERALKRMKKQHVLHLDLANLYKSILQMDKAAEHYLNYYKRYPNQHNFLQNQILNLTKSDIQIEQVIGVINKSIEEQPNNHHLKEILAGIFIKTQEYDAAFELYKSLENIKKDGKYLYKFGKEMQKNKAFLFALSSFKNILEMSQSKYTDLAYYQLANTYYEIAKNPAVYKNNISMEEALQNAITIFEDIVSKNTIQKFSDLSSVRLGDIYLKFYFDLDKSVYYYKNIIEKFPRSKIAGESQIKLGDVYLKKANFKEALNAYTQAKGKNSYSLKIFKLGMLEYYQNNYSKSLEYFNLLLEKKGSSDSLANNVLDKSIFINSFRNDSLNLNIFAEAELLVFQQKYTEAIKKFNSLIERNTKIASDATREMIQILLRLKKYQEANIVLETMIDQYPDDYYIDEFLFRKALIEEILGNHKQALNLLQDLLNNYQTSLFYEKAREKARNLNEKLKMEKLSG